MSNINMTKVDMHVSSETIETESKPALKLRFTVGEVYWFARTLYTNKPMKESSFASIYMPWYHDLDKIEFLPLLCKEHHKVAWDQDPKEEKTCDGFIFVSPTDENDIWYNQYPSACYGQLDDTNDRVVFKHYETSELFVLDEAGNVKGDNGQMMKLPGSEAKWEYFESTFWQSRFTLASTMLSNLDRAISPPGRKQSGLDDEKLKQLEVYQAVFIARWEEASGKKVERYEWVLPPHPEKPEKGERHTGVYRFRLV